jgi:hypothetical protein
MLPSASVDSEASTLKRLVPDESSMLWSEVGFSLCSIVWHDEVAVSGDDIDSSDKERGVCSIVNS